ncbi:ATP-dependent DNA helicase PIF1-like protein [Tanacetum coccineum]
MVYLSCDSVDKTERKDAIDKSIFSPEFINGLKFSGVPNHRLALKVGVPVMLLRNIDQPNGLCNGTRLQICGDHVFGFLPRRLALRVAFNLGLAHGMSVKFRARKEAEQKQKAMSAGVVDSNMYHSRSLSALPRGGVCVVF